MTRVKDLEVRLERLLQRVTKDMNSGTVPPDEFLLEEISKELTDLKTMIVEIEEAESFPLLDRFIKGLKRVGLISTVVDRVIGMLVK